MTDLLLGFAAVAVLGGFGTLFGALTVTVFTDRDDLAVRLLGYGTWLVVLGFIVALVVGAVSS